MIDRGQTASCDGLRVLEDSRSHRCPRVTHKTYYEWLFRHKGPGGMISNLEFPARKARHGRQLV
jgi:hypothetical protein